MGDELQNLLKVLFVVGLIFFGIAKVFYNVFLKPFVSSTTSRPAQAQPPAPTRNRDLRDFLEELRRDLGHGDAQPKTDGLLDREEAEARPARAEPVVEVVVEEPPPPPSARPRAHIPSARAVPHPAAPAPRLEPVESAMVPLEEAPLETVKLTAVGSPSELTGGVLGTSLESAFVLTEVLGPPRALRRGGWRGAKRTV